MLFYDTITLTLGMRSLRLLKVWKVLAPCMKGLVLCPALALPPSMHMFSRSLLAGNLLQERDSGHCRLNSCRIRRHAAFTRSHSGLQGPAVLQCHNQNTRCISGASVTYEGVCGVLRVLAGQLHAHRHVDAAEEELELGAAANQR